MPSFDTVSEVDLQEVHNAIDRTRREVATRFDFKDTNSTIAFAFSNASFVDSTAASWAATAASRI
jgi:Uncharacterized protein conserved in bacteria, COG1666